MTTDHHATLDAARTWLDRTGRDQLTLPCARAHRGVTLAARLATRLDPTRTSGTHDDLRELWDRIEVSVDSRSPDRWGLVTETAHRLRHLITVVEVHQSAMDIGRTEAERTRRQAAEEVDQ